MSLRKYHRLASAMTNKMFEHKLKHPANAEYLKAYNRLMDARGYTATVARNLLQKRIKNAVEVLEQPNKQI